MSTELQHVRRRIRSIAHIRKVTGALQKVAAARLASDRRVLESARLYADRLTEALQPVRAGCEESDHPLLRAGRAQAPVCVLCFGSDRGLCGGYNTNLVNELRRLLQTADWGTVRLVVVGKILNRRARRLGMPVDQYFPQPKHSVRQEGVAQIEAAVTQGFLTGAYGQVHCLYTRFVSALRQTPTAQRLLPLALAPGGERRAMDAVSFEPSPDRILDGLAPDYVRGMVDLAFLNGVTSENAARQTAMSRATENAADLLNELRLSYSRVRQESITSEMLELVGGQSLSADL